MTVRPLPLAVSLVAGIMATLPASAGASVAFGVLPQSLTEAAVAAPQKCGAPVAPAMGAMQPVLRVSRMDKASAILGGRSSALERMRQQQSGQGAVETGVPASTSLAPAAARSGFTGAAGCQSLAMPVIQPHMVGAGITQHALGSDDFLASKRLPVRHTSFDAEWNRVRSQGLSRSTVANLARFAPGPANLSTLAAVNSWANTRIRYVEDRDLYGQADYWASASLTLSRRAGDCEDIAIAKMQLLAALGVPRSDMYLTVARDLVRNADHALLVVKLGGKYWLLDNSTNELLDASRSYDYRPIMSFSQSHKWLHGYSRL